VLQAVLTLSQVVGTSPTALTWSAAETFVNDLPAGRSTVVVLVAATVIGVLAWRSTRPATAAALLLLAGGALVVPAVLTGHSAAADNHLLAVTNLALHVVAAAVWVGGLVALIVHGRRTDEVVTASARFSRVALACFVVSGASGLLAAWLILAGRPGGFGAVLGTGYGWLLTLKLLALLALGTFGWQHRRRTLPALRDRQPGAFHRFAVAEAAVMLATIAVAVALAASPPPPATEASTAGPAPTAAAAEDAPAADPMAGHDHGDLSVGVLIDDTRFHVPSPVDPGSTVTVFNSSDTAATITADDGSFDVDVPAHALVTFPAPDEPGSYDFGSRTATGYRDVLVVE
jgi:putative copper resistance protein D